MDRSGKAVESAGARPGSERRFSPRVRSRIDASYEDVDRHVFLHTADLSEGGVFLVSPASPPTGMSATVLLEVPGNPVILRLRGTVARQQTHPVAGFAVQFDPRANTESSRKVLREFVESATSAASHPPTANSDAL